jgi:hypothetical protein
VVFPCADACAPPATVVAIRQHTARVARIIRESADEGRVIVVAGIGNRSRDLADVG